MEELIEQKDLELRQTHEEYGTLNQELATVSKQISELNKKLCLDDSDEKKDQIAATLIEELSTFLISLKQEKKYSLERRIKSVLNSLMHKEDFIGRVEVVINGEDMDIELYTTDDTHISKDSLSKGEQQLYATSILKALVDESGIQFQYSLIRRCRNLTRAMLQRLLRNSILKYQNRSFYFHCYIKS